MNSTSKKLDVCKNTLADIMPSGPGARLNKKQLEKLHRALCAEYLARRANGSWGQAKPMPSGSVLVELSQIVRKTFPNEEFSPTYIRKLRHAFKKTNEWLAHARWLEWKNSLPRRVTIPAGEWLLTDPCYVIPEGDWSSFLRRTLYEEADKWSGILTDLDIEYARIGVDMVPVPNTDNDLEGPDYTCKALIIGTLYGDGCYSGTVRTIPAGSEKQFSCGVDAGLIGFVSTDQPLQEESYYESIIGLRFTSDAPVKVAIYYDRLVFEFHRNGVQYIGIQNL